MSDELVDEIDDEKADDESRSEAIRRFVRRGMTPDGQAHTPAPAEPPETVPEAPEGPSLRQEGSRAERWLGSVVTLLVAGFVASEAFAAPVLSDVAFLGGVAALTYWATTEVVRRLRAAQAGDTDESTAAEPATGGD